MCLTISRQSHEWPLCRPVVEISEKPANGGFLFLLYFVWVLSYHASTFHFATYTEITAILTWLFFVSCRETILPTFLLPQPVSFIPLSLKLSYLPWPLPLFGSFFSRCPGFDRWTQFRPFSMYQFYLATRLGGTRQKKLNGLLITDPDAQDPVRSRIFTGVTCPVD